TLPMDPLALTAKPAHFQRQTNPRAVHGFFGNLEFRPHFCQNYTWTFVKTFPMEPVGPHGQNRPFLKSNDPRSRISTSFVPKFNVDVLEDLTYGANLTYEASWTSRPKRPIFKNFDLIFAKILPRRPLRHYLWSQLALTAKTTHFQSQTNPRADLTYGASSSSRPKRPIFKVKRSPEQTLHMEPVGPHSQNNPFSRSNDARSRPYLWSQLTLTAKMAHFQRQRIPGAVHGFSGDPQFRTHFCRNFTWTSIKILPMEPNDPHGQNGPFSRLNKPRSSWPKWPVFNVRQTPEQNFDLIFAEILHGRSLRPYLWSQFSLTAKTIHFQGQTIPELTYGASWPSRPKRPIFKVKRALAQNSRLIFVEILRGRPLRPYLWSQWALMIKTTHFQGQTIPGTSVKASPMEPVRPHSQNGPFSRSNDPRSRIPTSSLPKYYPDIRYDLTYGANSTSLSNRPIFKVKRSSIKDLIYEASWPSQPKRPIFQIKQTPEQPVDPHGQNGPFSRSNDRRSLTYGANWPSRTKIPIFKVNRALKKTLGMEPAGPHSQNSPFPRSNGPRSRPYLWNQLALTAKTAHFQGQTNPVAGHSLRPYLWSQLALMDKTLHFQGQSIPEADLTYGASWPTQPKHPIYKVKRSPADLSYGASWPSRPQRPIFNVKRTSEQTSVKTLPMELVGPHGQSGPFSRSNNSDFIFAEILRGRLLRPYLWIQLAFTAKTAHFQGQTNPRASKPPILPIFTLPIEPVGPHGQNGPFLRSTDPRSRIPISFLPKILLTSVNTLTLEPVGPHGQNGPFSSQIFTWTSVKTLPMDLIGPNDKMDYFQGQTNPGAAKTPHFQGQTIPRADLTYRASWPSRPKRSIFKVKRSLEQNSSQRYKPKTTPRNPKTPATRGRPVRSCAHLMREHATASSQKPQRRLHGKNGDRRKAKAQRLLPQAEFSKVVCDGGTALPVHFSSIAARKKNRSQHCKPETTHRNPKIPATRGRPAGSYMHLTREHTTASSQNPQRRLYDRNGDRRKAKSQRLLPQAGMLLYSFSAISAAASSLGLWDGATLRPRMEFSKVVCAGGRARPVCFASVTARKKIWSQLVSQAKMTHFKSQTIPGAALSYGAGWSPRPIRPIFKVKQALEQNQFVTIAKTAHFQGQTILGAGILTSFSPKYFTWTSVKTLAMEPVGHPRQNNPFSRSNEPWSRFTSDLEFDIIFAKIITWTSIKTLNMEPVAHHGQNDLCYETHFTPRPKRPIFKVKRTPEQTLTMEPVGHHGKMVNFEGQMIPKADLRYGISWSQQPKQPIFKVKRATEQTSVKTLAMELVHHHGQNGPFSRSNKARSRYGASWSPRPKRPIFNVKRAPEHYGANWSPWLKQPIFKVKRSPKQNYDVIFTKKFTWTSVKTLSMELVGHHGQTDPFSRSNDPRRSPRDFFVTQNFDINFTKNLHEPLLRPYLWSEFFTTAKTPIFKFKRPLKQFCQKISWMSIKTLAMQPIGPHGPKRPIFKVKKSPEQALAMEPVGHNDQNGPFSRSNDPRSSYRASWSPQPKQPIFKVKRSLEQDLVGHHDKKGPISRSNDPRSSYGASWSPRSKQHIFKVKRSPEQSTRFNGDPEFRCHFCQKFTWISVKTLAMESIGHHIQNGPFSRSNEPRSSWSPQPKQPIFKVKRALKQTLAMESVGHSGKKWPIFMVKRTLEQSRRFIGGLEFQRHFCQKFIWTSIKTFSMEPVVHGIFWSPEFRRHFHQKFTWTSVKTLAMEPVDHHGQDDPFLNSNDPRTSVKTLAMVPVDHHGQNSLFSRSNKPQSSYGAILSPRPKRPTFKVKRTPKQLVTTAKMAHLQGQTIPKACKPLILPIFVCYSPRDLLVTQNSDVIVSKNLHGAPLRPYLRSQLVTPAKTANIQGQTSHEAGKSPIFANFRNYIPQDLLVTQNFDVVFAKNVHGPPLRPYLWSQLVTTTKTAHFQGQTSPESTGFIGDPEFRRHSPQKCRWTSVKTLAMDPIGDHSQRGPFSRSNEPQSK
ncbi:hypothetical protein H5410_013550, partial [Solanum commersonii]